MKLVIPHTDFSLRTEKDRVIIDTKPPKEADPLLERMEVAKRLGRSLRMVDFYRRLNGEARLRSEKVKNRIMIRESELQRWADFIKTEAANYTLYANDGRFSGFRPRQARRGRVEKLIRNLSGLTLAKNSTGTS